MKDYLNKDLYEILGTTFDADVVTIKAAYRKQARLYHPDVNKEPGSIEKFKEITEAYEFLLDVQKRKQYDQIKGFARKKAAESNAQCARAQKAYSYAGEKTINSTFEAKEQTQEQKTSDKSFSSVFDTIMEGLFPDEEPKNPKKKDKKSKEPAKEYCKPKDGRDINLEVKIKISEVINGTHRTVNVLHLEKCPKCEGRKFINGAKCPMCKGTGEISIHKKLSVKIPANVKNGAKIRIANEGNQGCFGGKNGDLYLTIQVEEHSLFKYDGLNVSCEIPITPYEAALGANIEVPTISSAAYMKIPAGTTSGQKFRLAGEGLSDGNKRGDQIITVKIEMPKDITNEEKELYEKLKDLSKRNIRENLKNG